MGVGGGQSASKLAEAQDSPRQCSVCPYGSGGSGARAIPCTSRRSLDTRHEFGSTVLVALLDQVQTTVQASFRARMVSEKAIIGVFRTNEILQKQNAACDRSSLNRAPVTSRRGVMSCFEIEGASARAWCSLERSYAYSLRAQVLQQSECWASTTWAACVATRYSTTGVARGTV